IARSIHNKLIAVKDIKYNIAKRYDFDVYITNDTLCKEQYSRRFLVIRNDMYFENTYKIKSKCRGYEYNNETITISPGGIVWLPIEIPPLEKDNLKICFSVEELTGKTSKRIETIIPVENCYQPELIVPEDIVIPEYAENIDLFIRNIGTRTTSFNISIHPEGVVIHNPNITLDPGEEAWINHTLVLTPGDYEFRITARPLVGGVITLIEKKFDVRVIQGVEAQRPVVKPSRISIKSGSVRIINLSIRNKGIEPSVYNVRIGSSFFNKDLSENISLFPGEEENIELLVNASFLDKDTSLEQVIDINITASNGYNYEEELIVKAKRRLFIYRWIDKTKAWLSMTKEWVIDHKCESIAIILGLLIIAEIVVYISLHSKRPESILLKKWIILLGIILLVIAVILGAYLFISHGLYIPRNPRVSINGLNYSMPTGKVVKINLSQYFYDPDLDVLSFEAINTSSGLIVLIDKDIASIESHEQGVYSTIFLAHDEKGGMATSDPFIFNVTKSMSICDWFKDYTANNCWLIDYKLFILLEFFLFLIGIEVLREQKYKPRIVRR
ncbi:hypothetical protein J7K74_01825, partial [Candidatus Woesearchaeota archaeon]|nr:hypothetical protein [Candidatus Woesearchaeota archaeon]